MKQTNTPSSSVLATKKQSPPRTANTTLVEECYVVCTDNLPFMRTLPDGFCDLIYADPPFNANRVMGNRDSPRFDDRHDGGRDGYLDFLRLRLVEMRRLLSPKGSLYVHLDWRSSHHVKLMLDEVFGEANFVNEIIWSYRGGARPGRWFARKHDTIFLYAKGLDKHTFHCLRGGEYRTRDLQYDDDGRPYKTTRKGRIYFHDDGPALTDVWDLPILSTVSKQRTGYPTQKPEALLERIVEVSSSPGDRVGDFFCGSGTAMVVASRLNRKWIGCDSNPDAVRITQTRLAAEVAANDGPSTT